MKDIRISDDALDDLADGCDFYDAQEDGVGEYFISCLRSDIQRLGFAAGIHPKVYGGYHRALSRLFPFAIFYTIESETVDVWAVVDCRRDPGWIRDRLGL